MSEPLSVASTAGHAWSTTPRREPPKRIPGDRTSDFCEIYGCYDETTAREQAARCVQCPNPLCVAGCPLHLEIPRYLSLVADGEFLEAAATLHTTATMPEICARLCPADKLCEGMCIITGRAEPVAIWALEQYLNEYAFAHGVAYGSLAPSNGRRVAVVGLTAGGLACASELAKRGYAVTMFAGAGETGLLSETPAFRLDPAIAQRRIAMLTQQRVQVHSVEMPCNDLRERLAAEFDSVYLAPSARRPRRPDIPGLEAKGVVQAGSFIAAANSTNEDARSAFDVAGKRVVVIGGGDTAIDCLRTALRRGARQAIGIYRRNEESMPCSRREYENAIEEGAVYAFGATPVAVLANEQAQVSGLRLIRTVVGSMDAARETPVVCRPGTEFELETDWIFLALGFDRALPPIADSFRTLVGPAGTVLVDDRHMTAKPGTFAGGELVRGPCLPLEAVQDAREAAAEIDRYLGGATPVPFA